MRDSSQTSVSEQDIREELALLLQSSTFQQSRRLARFLRFTVERAISGKLEDLKEYTIGVEVYDRQPTYNPSLDSIVRSEARRLRTKLKEYYQGEGKDRRVFIYYRLGSYIPLFKETESLIDAHSSSVTTLHVAAARTARPLVAVLPFANLSETPAALAFGRGIADDLIHLLSTTGNYRVMAASTVTPLVAQGVDVTTLASRLGIDIAVEGAVRQENARFRITSGFVDAEGYKLSSHRFEACVEPDQIFTAQEQIAVELADRLSVLLKPRISGFLRSVRTLGEAALGRRDQAQQDGDCSRNLITVS